MKDIRLLNGLFIGILVAGAVNAILIYLQVYRPYKENEEKEKKEFESGIEEKETKKEKEYKAGQDMCSSS